MKLIVDVNLPPDLCAALKATGWEAVHWAEIGDVRARDDEILAWTRREGAVLVSHDLDFGAILAATGGNSPSVVQIRTEDVLSDEFLGILTQALRDFSGPLAAGAILSVDALRARVHVLPLTRPDYGTSAR